MCILRLVPRLTSMHAASGQSLECPVHPYLCLFFDVCLGAIHLFPQPAIHSISPLLLLPQASVSSSVQWRE